MVITCATISYVSLAPRSASCARQNLLFVRPLSALGFHIQSLLLTSLFSPCREAPGETPHARMAFAACPVRRSLTALESALTKKAHLTVIASLGHFSTALVWS